MIDTTHELFIDNRRRRVRRAAMSRRADVPLALRLIVHLQMQSIVPIGRAGLLSTIEIGGLHKC